MMYGVKFENNQIVIEEGTEEELKNLGFTDIFDTFSQANAYGRTMEYYALRDALKAMSPEEIDSKRGKELQRRIWKESNPMEGVYPSDKILYGAKIEDDKILIEEGLKEELRKKGYDRLFETYSKANASAHNLECRLLRYEFNSMSTKELDSERAKDLEKRLWGNMQDIEYVPGANIEQRKKNLLEAMEKAAH